MCYFESRVEIGSRLRSLVRSRVDIERVLIPEKRCDNDAHVIAYFRARRIYIRSVSLFARRKIVQNKSRNVIERGKKVYK